MLERFKKIRPAAVVSLVMSLISATSLSAADGDSAQMRSLENRVTALEARKGVCPSSKPAVKEGVDISLAATVNFLWYTGGNDYAVVSSASTPVTVNTATAGLNLSSIEKAGPHGNWGVDVLLGYETPTDMTFTLRWGWAEGKQHDSVSGVVYPTQLPGVFSMSTAPTGSTAPNQVGAMSLAAYADASTKSKVTINEGELSWQRGSFLGRHFAFTPKMGLFAAWLDVKQNAEYTNPWLASSGSVAVVQDSSWAVNVKDDMWIVGPNMGMETQYFIGDHFFVFGSGNVTPSYAKHKLSRIDTVTIAGSTSGPVETTPLMDKFYGWALRTQGELGIGLTTMFDSDRYAVAARLSWSAESITNAFIIPVLSGDGSDMLSLGRVDYLDGNFGAQGIAFNLSLDF